VFQMAKIHISSGGVIYRITSKNKIEILLLHKKNGKWHLPKGTQKEGENLEKTVLREVKEETELETEIGKYLGKLPSLNEDKEAKVTHYYLMKPCGGKIGIRKDEHNFDKVEWVEIEKVKQLLREFTEFEKEEKIVGMAEKIIKKELCD